MLDLVRQIGCLPLDPINAVARSHLLVLWSRLGSFDRAEVDRLLWTDRALFEYWAHAASIVLTEDYPLHAGMMRNWIRRESPWAKRFGEWADQNRSLPRHVLAAQVRAVHAEPRPDREAHRALFRMLNELAGFLGAQTIEYGRVPSAWHKALG